jgi:hypothetical protein
MTTSNDMNDASDTNDHEANLASVAGRLLGAMPPRMPQRLPALPDCCWCTEGTVKGSGWRQRQADPAAWVVHVLGEHLRGLLAQARVSVDFNSAGGATVRLHDAYPEDVALARDALGVQLSGVVEFDVNGQSVCAVYFGRNPYGREATLAWYTTPDFLRLAAQLAAAG